MNAYQQKWVDMLKAADLKGWEIKGVDDSVYVDMPAITDLKLIRDNVPATLAALSLDIDLPKSRLKFIFQNGHENFEYILNPGQEDLTNE